MVARLEAGDSLASAATYAFTSTAFPMLTGTLVMIAGFIPVGFAASSAGEYCYTLFTVVLIALISSWIVAVLFSPLTGSWLLRHAAETPHWHRTPGQILPAPAYQSFTTQATDAWYSVAGSVAGWSGNDLYAG